MEAGLLDAEETLLSDAIEQYQDHLRATGREESTAEEAGYRLRPLLRESVEHLTDVRPRHIERRLASVESIAGRTGTRARINAFFKWAMKTGLCPTNPCAGIIVEGRAKRGKHTLTRVEARLFNNLLVNRVRAGDQAALALLVVLRTGYREGELLRLQVRDLDLDVHPPVLSVERQAKTPRGLRDVEIDDELAVLLREHVAGRELQDWVWSSERSKSGHREKTWLLKACRKLCDEAGVQQVCPQGLRGTHGKLARSAGQTARIIADALGHEDTRTTVKSYVGEETDEQAKRRQALKVLQGGRA